jgi:hypothetical protein
MNSCLMSGVLDSGQRPLKPAVGPNPAVCVAGTMPLEQRPHLAPAKPGPLPGNRSVPTAPGRELSWSDVLGKRET